MCLLVSAVWVLVGSSFVKRGAERVKVLERDFMPCCKGTRHCSFSNSSWREEAYIWSELRYREVQFPWHPFCDEFFDLSELKSKYFRHKIKNVSVIQLFR